jgi:hypothetical protein
VGVGEGSGVAAGGTYCAGFFRGPHAAMARPKINDAPTSVRPRMDCECITTRGGATRSGACRRRVG